MRAGRLVRLDARQGIDAASYAAEYRRMVVVQ
jgi:hypothetical protein